MKLSRHDRIVAFALVIDRQFNDFNGLTFVVSTLLPFSLNDLLQLVASPADGESLVIQELPDAPDHEHFMVLVIAAVASPLHGAQLRELLLPIPEYVWFDSAQIPHFANGEIAFGWNWWERFFHENQGGTDRTLKFTLTQPIVCRGRQKCPKSVANGMLCRLFNATGLCFWVVKPGQGPTAAEIVRTQSVYPPMTAVCTCSLSLGLA